MADGSKKEEVKGRKPISAEAQKHLETLEKDELFDAHHKQKNFDAKIEAWGERISRLVDEKKGREL